MFQYNETVRKKGGIMVKLIYLLPVIIALLIVLFYSFYIIESLDNNSKRNKIIISLCGVISSLVSTIISLILDGTIKININDLCVLYYYITVIFSALF